MLGHLWRLLWKLVRDLAEPVLRKSAHDDGEQAKDDDVLDAWLDHDEIDASGL